MSPERRVSRLGASVSEARRPKHLRAATRLARWPLGWGAEPVVAQSPSLDPAESQPRMPDGLLPVSGEAARWLTEGQIPAGLVPLLGDPTFPASEAELVPPPVPTAVPAAGASGEGDGGVAPSANRTRVASRVLERVPQPARTPAEVAGGQIEQVAVKDVRGEADAVASAEAEAELAGGAERLAAPEPSDPPSERLPGDDGTPMLRLARVPLHSPDRRASALAVAQEGESPRAGILGDAPAQPTPAGDRAPGPSPEVPNAGRGDEAPAGSGRMSQAVPPSRTVSAPSGRLVSRGRRAAATLAEAASIAQGALAARRDRSVARSPSSVGAPAARVAPVGAPHGEPVPGRDEASSDSSVAPAMRNGLEPRGEARRAAPASPDPGSVAHSAPASGDPALAVARRATGSAGSGAEPVSPDVESSDTSLSPVMRTGSEARRPALGPGARVEAGPPTAERVRGFSTPAVPGRALARSPGPAGAGMEPAPAASEPSRVEPRGGHAVPAAEENERDQKPVASAMRPVPAPPEPAPVPGRSVSGPAVSRAEPGHVVSRAEPGPAGSLGRQAGSPEAAGRQAASPPRLVLARTPSPAGAATSQAALGRPAVALLARSSLATAPVPPEEDSAAASAMPAAAGAAALHLARLTGAELSRDEAGRDTVTFPPAAPPAEPPTRAPATDRASETPVAGAAREEAGDLDLDAIYDGVVQRLRRDLRHDRERLGDLLGPMR